MKLHPRASLASFLLVSASLAGLANAATITYIGLQTNVETFSNDTTDGWRNPTTPKPFDADNDNIIGTDGYDFAGSSSVASLPSYVASVTNFGGHNDNNRGLVDNPTNAAGPDIGIGWNGSGGQTITFQGNSLATETLRLSVLHDANWSLAWGERTMTLTQMVGGSDSVTTPVFTHAGDGLDVSFFDLSGIQDGDTFRVTVAQISGASWRQIGGVAFDVVSAPASAIPEPSSALLVGLGALGFAVGRRRVAA